LFPLAGLGGKGREKKVSARCSGRGSGISSPLALIRGAEWRPSSSSSTALLAYQGGEGKKESPRRQAADSLLFKCGCSSAASATSILVSLADRGGEEVEKTGSTAPAPVLHLRENLEIYLPVAISKRRPGFVAAIHCKMGGLAMLDAVICESSYFLFVRIFCSFDPAPKPPRNQVVSSLVAARWRRLISAHRRRIQRIRLHLRNPQ
jgi:hypothetical protein